MVSDGDATQDAGVLIDGNVIFDYRVAWYVEDVAIGIVFEVL